MKKKKKSHHHQLQRPLPPHRGQLQHRGPRQQPRGTRRGQIEQALDGPQRARPARREKCLSQDEPHGLERLGRGHASDADQRQVDFARGSEGRASRDGRDGADEVAAGLLESSGEEGGCDFFFPTETEKKVSFPPPLKNDLLLFRFSKTATLTHRDDGSERLEHLDKGHRQVEVYDVAKVQGEGHQEPH